MSTQACMGGWCAQRDKCPHYHAVNRGAPHERLCISGQDGVMVRTTKQGAVMRHRLIHAADRLMTERPFIGLPA